MRSLSLFVLLALGLAACGEGAGAGFQVTQTPDDSGTARPSLVPDAASFSSFVVDAGGSDAGAAADADGGFSYSNVIP